MPQLVEWMVHHPRDWTTVQAKAYGSHVLGQLVQGIKPVNEALGPATTAAILLSAVGLLAQCNPLSARDICKHLANAFDMIDEIDPLKEAVAQ